ncbi:MAG: transporter substrate-binding domain-containing protein [Clostridiales bacterium]|nr:transporter substrate-binding domain-containing protein [Clostridiales bacterium]
MKIKKLMTILLALMLIVVMAACGGNSGSEEAADAGEETSEAASGTPAIFATQDLSDTCTVSKAGGYFEEYMGDGISVENFASGRDINNALKADSADFGGAYGICPVATALTSGVDFKVIYIATRIQGTEGLVVREDAGIESVKDLKGKKVGVTLASSGHYGLLCALEDEGMTADDIELVDMQPDAINAAWMRGDIDVAYTWNPTLINLKNNGGKVLLTVKDLAEKGHSTYNFYVVRTKYAEENPDQVVKFLKAVQKGAVQYKEDQDTAIKMAADRLELEEDVVKEQMSDIYPTLEEQMSDDCFGSDNAAQNLFNVASFLQQNGQIDDAKDVEFFKSKIDTSYLEQAIKELEEEE